VNICHIAALSRNNVIGNKGQIPWHIPEDLKHFMRTTLHHPIIMGRGTFESIGSKPLKNRFNIVVSSSMQPKSTPELAVVPSLEAALKALVEEEGDVFVVGGQSLYEQTLPITCRWILTHVDIEVPGDTFYPDLSEIKLECLSETTFLQNDPPYRIYEYKKVTPFSG
jgi:dihydrofolate reductase